jgi:hypothetical protein
LRPVPFWLCLKIPLQGKPIRLAATAIERCDEFANVKGSRFEQGNILQLGPDALAIDHGGK